MNEQLQKIATEHGGAEMANGHFQFDHLSEALPAIDALGGSLTPPDSLLNRLTELYVNRFDSLVVDVKREGLESFPAWLSRRGWLRCVLNQLPNKTIIPDNVRYFEGKWFVHNAYDKWMKVTPTLVECFLHYKYPYATIKEVKAMKRAVKAKNSVP